MLLDILAKLVEITALVLRVEVHKWFRMVRVQPDLAEDAHVDVAHELLTDNIEAVCCAD